MSGLKRRLIRVRYWERCARRWDSCSNAVAMRRGLFRCDQFQRDGVGTTELQNVGRADVLDRFMDDAEFIEMPCGGIQLDLTRNGERNVVQADPILVERVTFWPRLALAGAGVAWSVLDALRKQEERLT